MAQLTISDAARRCGCPRSTLQRAIRAGRLHLDAEHHLDADELAHAGYLPAPAALQEQAPAAPRPRQYALQGLDVLLRDMQRTMERLADVLDSLTNALHHMQQERSGRVLQTSDKTLQLRGMERPPEALPERDMEPPPDPVLAQIRRWQDEGMTLRAIAARLNADGVPTRSGQGKWYQSNLSRLLARAARHQGRRKLTPLQVAELRGKRAAGAPIKALMQEYGLSKATVHRYLKTPGASPIP
jgi:Recombinase